MIEELRHYFGELAGAKYNSSCTWNALHNLALLIYIGLDADILYINTVDFCHAYLSDHQKAYSKGLTWKDERFPELTIAEILALGGHDITLSLIAAGLRQQSGFDHVLACLEQSVPGVAKSMQRYYSDRIAKTSRSERFFPPS